MEALNLTDFEKDEIGKTELGLVFPSALDNKAAELSEKYFNDMRLEKGSIVEKFFLFKYTNGRTAYDLPDEFSNTLNVNNYRYVVGTLEKAAGETNHITRTVTIAPEYENDDNVLLHELIHVFEGLYDLEYEYINHYGEKVEPHIFTFIREALLLSLYNDLKGKIDDLDSRILAHANLHSGTAIYNKGGSHDILLFLKSLDLDLRCGLKLGTICSYGRDDFIPRVSDDCDYTFSAIIHNDKLSEANMLLLEMDDESLSKIINTMKTFLDK